MTSRDFCYWLQGYFEIEQTTATGRTARQGMNDEQVELVKRHLAMVFKHDIDPSFNDADELRGIHTPAPTGLREALEEAKNPKRKPRNLPRNRPGETPIMC